MIEVGGSGNINSIFNFPRQNLSKSEKIKEYGSEKKWAEATMLYIERLSAFYYTNNRDRLYNKPKLNNNINLVKYGKADNEAFSDLIKQYGETMGMEFPTSLVHYDIISAKINLLAGEEMARPFNYVVMNQSPSGAEKISDITFKLHYANVEREFIQEVQQSLQQQGVDPATIQQLFPELPPPPVDEAGKPLENGQQITNYIKYNYSDFLEKTAANLLEYLAKQERLTEKFNQSNHNFLMTGVEIACIETQNGVDPHVRIVDPRMFDCDITIENDFIEDPSWAREIRYMTSSDIHDEYHKDLTEDEVKYIENFKGGANVSTLNPNDYFIQSYVDNSNRSSIIRVALFEWKSLKKVYFVTRQNPETGEETVEMELQRPKSDEPGFVSVETSWITERWEGTKIGREIFTRVRPVPNQYNDITNPSKSSSKYVGLRLNYCIVDMILPYQFMFNSVMHHIKLAMSRDKGKAIIYDINQIPHRDGWDLEKFLYWANESGIMFVDPTQNYDKGNPSTFNQFQQIDRSSADIIIPYINQLQAIRNEVDEITGITKQRQGNISTSETVGGVERSVTQSSAITEGLFFKHNVFKELVLQRLLNLGVQLIPEKSKYSFLTDDRTRKMFEIEEDNFKLSDYGVFVSNSSKDNKILQQFKDMAQIALQQQQITLSDWFNAMQSNSSAEIKSILIEAEKAKQQQASQMQQEQSQQMQQIEQQKAQAELAKEQAKAQAQAELEQAKMQTQLQLEQFKSDTAIKLQELKHQQAIEIEQIRAEAEITARREDIDADVNNNGILDVLERDKLALEKERLYQESRLKEKELQLKDKDISNKAEIEKSKIKQEQIKQETAEIKLKEARHKEEQIKQQDQSTQ